MFKKYVLLRLLLGNFETIKSEKMSEKNYLSLLEEEMLY